MLRLERMEVSGFKSFCDRTRVDFPEGITAIVGPNGCGKSNLGDAINWVLGEQSAKMLRGSQMTDVIFGGSAGRKPLGLAEVTLVFGGGDGLGGDDRGRVTITRRLFRSGESEYLVNGKRSRLKDIVELLRDGHVGARTYATIEQGKIDQVLNAKPKDRRALIEDAAGISGYKHKRRLAELKLDATRANLLRVNDIVIEVQRQINSLKRQAAKARRYRKLRDELRGKERVRFSRQAHELEQQLEKLRTAEREAHDREAEAAATLGKLDADLVTERESLEQASQEFRNASESLHQREIEIERSETQIRSCRERIAESHDVIERQQQESERLTERLDIAATQGREHQDKITAGAGDLARLIENLAARQAELETATEAQRTLREEIETLRKSHFDAMSRGSEIRNQIRSTEEALERSHQQRQRLEAEQHAAQADWSRVKDRATALSTEWETHEARLAALRTEFAQGEADLKSARERQEVDIEALSAARQRSKSALAQLSTLEDLSTRFAGVSDGVKSLLGGGRSSGIRTHGVVADYVEASRDVEGAAESYLQWLLPTVILEDDADASRAANMLREEGAGRTTMLCRSQPGPGTNGHGTLPAEVAADSRIKGRLLDQLTVKSQVNGVVAERIGNAVLVDDLDAALELHRKYPKVDYLTSDGEVVYASGIISAGGKKSGDEGLLAHNRRTEEVRREAAQAEVDTEAVGRRVEETRSELVRLEVEVRQRRTALDDAERRGVELQHKVEQSKDETERSGRRSEVLTDELNAIATQIAPLKQALETILGDRELAEEEHQALESRLKESLSRLESDEATRNDLVARVTDLRAEEAAGRQLQESLENEGRRLAEAVAELEARIAGIRTEIDAAGQRRRTSDELLARTESELVDHLEAQKAQVESAKTMEEQIVQRREDLGAKENSLRDLRTQLEACREGTREAELQRTRVEGDRQHLDDLCRQELGMPALDAAMPEDEDAPAVQLDEEIDLQALQVDIEDIKQKIERIGPVNMTAIEEFSALEERNEFLTSQRQDLQNSMDSLTNTIKRINRDSRQRFIEVFEQIRQSYQEVFKLLFSGGRADLRLEEGEDVLECGIDILAQPPGKRLTGVHLMSGGEKALSAIALLFAIFRHQPSPFCLLDEVDAALDDANVGRFARMVQEYAKNTQFILVTHNKLSMDAADLIYGVTMEEPGVSKLMSMQLEPASVSA